jgi:hypothetical protein
MATLGVPNLNALNRGMPMSSVVSNDNSFRPGGSVVQNFNFPNSDADSFRKSEAQVRRSSRRMLGV